MTRHTWIGSLVVALGACGGGSTAPVVDGAIAVDAPVSIDATPAPTGVDVLTQHNDLARTGANLAETELTVATVSSDRFGKLFAREVDDEVYAQPLIVSDLVLPGAAGPRNVLYVATVGDTIYAFDADDPTAEPWWHRTLLEEGEVPVRNTDMTGACEGNYTDFSGNIGIVGTPVIDRASETIYAVSRVRRGDEFIQRFNALSLLDGSHRPGSPVRITASVPGTGDGNVDGVVTFDDLKENQRTGLVLLNGVVYMTWAGHCDWGPYHGWVMGYDAQTLEQVTVFNTTPNGYAAGIWQSGQAMASDGEFLYAVTGNGSVGEGRDLGALVNRGQSFLKLRPAGGTLEIVSWFTPYNWEYLEAYDLDLGSAGMLLIPGTQLAVSGGKGGWMYVVDRHDMGGLSENGVDDNIVQTFELNDPKHLHGSPVYWAGPGGPRVYTWAEEDYLKAFPVLDLPAAPGAGVTALDVDNLERSQVRAAVGMPGAMLSISANGSAAGTGVIWASLPFEGDANQAVQPGLLRAFDASDVSRELWTSHDVESDDCGKFAKFSNPTIANGKVYLASFSGQVCVYGLRP